MENNIENNIEYKVKKRKKLIAKISAVFFAVLLILTFFSNTIMNYSLPEVSTDVIYSDSVSSKIRGSGLVESAEAVSVTSSENKKISEILVKEGDEVKKDDVLVRFEEGESEEYKNAVQELEELKKSYNSKILLEEIDEDVVKQSQNGGYDYNKAMAELAALRGTVDAANAEVKKYQDKAKEISENYTLEDIDREYLLEENTKLLEEAQIKADEAVSAHTKYLEKLMLIDEMKAQYETIKSKEESVQKMNSMSQINELKAECEGVIISVNAYKGQEVSANEEIMSIQDSSKGNKLSLSVTKNQAAKVKKGDEASLDNAWYYDNDVKIKLNRIKPDPESPATNKILEFDVEGSINPGENVSISIGEKSQTYDCVVPNSAIREDKKGKFVFVVEKKSSPLGNRYVARRVQVEVIISDDSNTAISGAVEQGDNVLVTASKAVNSGDYVRLAK